MAYQKKAKEETQVTPEIKEEAVVTEPVKEVKQPPKQIKIDRDVQVEVRNVTNDALHYHNANGYSVDWTNHGDSQWITVGELLNMRASQNRFLTEPWIVIDDEDVAQYLGLTAMYNKMLPVQDIESFLFSGVDNIKAVLAVLPKGAKELVRDKAREMFSNDTLYDTRVIKVLMKELDIDFDLFKEE